MAKKKKKTGWTLTDAARSEIPEWNRKWERIILSTDEIDFDRAADAVRGMYAAANLAEPVIVRCLSPMQGAIVWAWAAAYWDVVGNAVARDVTRAVIRAATRAATYDATRAATYAATDDATRAATYDATYAATSAATDAATRAATIAATDNATRAATYAATRAATYAATDDATRLCSDPYVGIWKAASEIILSKLGHNLFQKAAKIAETNVRSWYYAYNGGNEWASWCAFLSFPRDICGWESPTHANYAHYENAAIHGGGRFMHTKFCLLCERPLVRKTRVVGAAHQLHCEDGPSIEWKCGTKAWHLGGVTATEKAVMRPHELTPEDVHAVRDEELRSAMLERYPWPRYLGDVGATCIDEGANEIEGTYEALFDAPQVGQRRMVATCATGHIVSLGVPSSINTLQAARRYLSPFGNISRIVART